MAEEEREKGPRALVGPGLRESAALVGLVQESSEGPEMGVSDRGARRYSTRGHVTEPNGVVAILFSQFFFTSRARTCFKVIFSRDTCMIRTYF